MVTKHVLDFQLTLWQMAKQSTASSWTRHLPASNNSFVITNWHTRTISYLRQFMWYRVLKNDYINELVIKIINGQKKFILTSQYLHKHDTIIIIFLINNTFQKKVSSDSAFSFCLFKLIASIISYVTTKNKRKKNLITNKHRKH